MSQHKGPNALPFEIQRQHQEAIAKGRAAKEQAELVFWLYSHAREKGLSNREVGELINYDSSNISRIYSLLYTGNLNNICKKNCNGQGQCRGGGRTQEIWFRRIHRHHDCRRRFRGLRSHPA